MTEQHASYRRPARSFGAPSGLIDIAGNVPATAFDDGQG